MAFGSGTRQWVRGTLAKIATSTAVLGQGELLVDEAGGVYAGDGATQIKNLRRAARVDELSPSPFGFTFTVDPGMIRPTDAVAMDVANRGLYLRVRDGATVSKIGMWVGTSSGNISVSAYRNSGTGRASVPGTRLATSGAVPCPATGYSEVVLGSSVTVQPGDWLALSADNATATFHSLLAATNQNDLALGRALGQTAAHPLPATPSSLQAFVGFTIVLIGVA